MTVKKTVDKLTLFSKSKLAIRYDIDRAAVSRRLTAAGIEQHPESTSNEQLYEITKALEIALRKNSAEQDDKTIQQIDLKNRKLEIELARLEETVFDRKEVVDALASIVNGLHTKIVIQDIKNLVKKVRAAKDADAATEIARIILNAPFMDARENHERYLKDE